MNNPEKNQFNEQLRERTVNMASAVRNLLKSTSVDPIDRPIVNQLIRSSSSVAANYRSVTRGRSDAEFYSKICIVAEESDETLFWVDYLVRINVLTDSQTRMIRDELDQFVRLFATIKRKMKEKIERSGTGVMS